MLKELKKHREALLITHHGRVKAVLQDVAAYEETHETLALLNILALSSRQAERGELVQLNAAVRRMRTKTDAT